MLKRKAHHCFAALKGDAALNVAALVVAAFSRAVEIKHSRRDLPQGELTYGKKRPGLNTAVYLRAIMESVFQQTGNTINAECYCNKLTYSICSWTSVIEIKHMSSTRTTAIIRLFACIQTKVN